MLQPPPQATWRRPVEEEKILQRSCAAKSWTRALWDMQGLLESIREPERATESQCNPESELKMRTTHLKTLKWSLYCRLAYWYKLLLCIQEDGCKQFNTTLLCCKMLKYYTFCHEISKHTPKMAPTALRPKWAFSSGSFYVAVQVSSIVNLVTDLVSESDIFYFSVFWALQSRCKKSRRQRQWFNGNFHLSKRA